MNRFLISIAILSASLPTWADTSAARDQYWGHFSLPPDHIETFETLPIAHDDGTHMAFSQQGVTYQSLAGNPLVVHSAGSHGQFPDDVMPTTSAVLTGNGYDHIEIVFDQPVSKVSFDFIINTVRSPTVLAFYDPAGTLILHETWAAGWPPGWYFGASPWTYTGLVQRIEYSNSFGDAINGGIDNLEWLSAPVPEPSTWLLMAAGAGLLLRRVHTTRRA